MFPFQRLLLFIRQNIAREKKVFLSFSILLAVTSAYGNAYKKYDVRSGLSGNCIRSITQDSIGYMWFATQDGLNRFNGVEFTNYVDSSEKGNNHMNIVSVHKHPDNRHIWVASAEKLYKFNIIDETFSSFEKLTAEGISVHSVFSLEYDKYSRLWIGSANGLFMYDEKNDSLRLFQQSSSDPHSLPSNHVWVVYRDLAGDMWIGTRDGLARYNESTDNFFVFRTEGMSFGRPACNEILSLLETSQGTLWVGTWYGGLARFDKTTGEFTYYYGEGGPMAISRVRTLFQLTANTLYVGSDNGLFTFNTNTGECWPEKDELQDESIYACYKDREGSFWIGTYFSGAFYLSVKHKDFEWYYNDKSSNSLSGNVVSQFCEDEEGNIWVATENGGLNRFNPRTKEFKYISIGSSDNTIHFQNIHALLYEEGELWIGTFSQGLYIMNIKTGATRNYRYNTTSPQSIPNDHIYSLYKGKDGTIYIGTLSGFCIYDRSSDSFERVPELSRIFIYDIKEDAAGNLWLASKRDGVWKYDKKTNTYRNYRHKVGDPNSLTSNWVIGVYIDSKDNLWFCTEGNGISRYDYQNDCFENYSTHENLPNTIIYGMLDDLSGNLWLSSNNGLIRYEPQKKRSQLYTAEDGLQSNQFNFRSSYRASNGKFYFGGVNGFNSFYPSQLSVNGTRPNSSISAVRMYSAKDKVGQSKRVSVLNGKIRIPYQISSFDVLFESLSFVAPGKNRYSYKLDDIHDDWIQTNKHSVSFINLAPGSYTFRIRSSNNDGYWSENDSVLLIEVVPPPWKTIYAQIIYFLLAIGLGWLLVRFYMRKQEERKIAKIKELEHLKDKEVSQAKITFFTQVAHEIKTPVTLIKAPLEAIMEVGEWNEEVESNLSVINKNTNRLLELIKQLLDFRKIDKKGYTLSFSLIDVNALIEDIAARFRVVSLSGIKISLSLPESHLEYYIDKEAFTKIISNLLSNATKYAKSSIVVSFAETDNEGGRKLQISIGDDGPGIPESEYSKIFQPFYQINGESDKGVGIGLSLVKLLVEKHNGEVYVNPQYKNGCEIVVEIPYVETMGSQENPIQLVDVSPEEEEEEEDVLAAADNHSVLIVEDTPDMLDFLDKNLSGSYTIYRAGNGLEALQCLESTTIDLIVSDIVMPEMNGFELLKAIRSDDMLCHIPFILLSAQDSIDSKIKGLDYGADAYIEKPFSLHYLRASISNLLESRRMLFNRFSSSPDMPYDQTAMNKADVKWLDKINEIIRNNFTNEQFTIDRLAEEVAVSRSNLQRKLKGLTGMPPNDYIRLMRLKTAAKLLKEGEYRVNEVCHLVGFNNLSYFARCFHKQFGILPKDYTKKH